MKRSVRSAIALLILLVAAWWPAGVASAQDKGGTETVGQVTGRITLDCYGDPETVTVENTGEEPFVIDSIGSRISSPEHDVSWLSDQLAPGESITYQSGPAASGPHVLTRNLIFEDSSPEGEDGVHVDMHPKSVPLDRWRELADSQLPFIYVGCTEGRGDFVLGMQTFQLTLYGTETGRNLFHVRSSQMGSRGGGPSVTFCQDYVPGPTKEVIVPPPCAGGGTEYTRVRPVGVMREGDDTLAVEWVRTRPLCERPGSDPNCRYREDTFATATMPIAMDATQVAWYDFDTGVGGMGQGPSIPDNQQADTKADKQPPDNQQTDGGKDTGTGAGDGQQDTGAGKAPDNQQGSGEMVAKTYQLTLNGTVPADQRFFVSHALDGNEPHPFPLCDPAAPTEPVPDCEGDGSVYTVTIDVRLGTTIEYTFHRVDHREDAPLFQEPFHSGTETIVEDTTNTAWYTFGTGAGDEQQDDAQDNEHGETPEEMPDAGAGGLVSGKSIPLSSVVATVMILLGLGYTVVRRT